MASFPHILLAKLRALDLPLCVPIAGSTIAEFRSRVAGLPDGYRLLELRLDYLTSPAEELPAIAALVQAHPHSIFLATCRPVGSGGRLQGSADDELAFLSAAAQAGCPLVDLSLESAEEIGPTACTTLRSTGAAVQLSFHDFEGTPDLQAVLARMRRLQPDLYKIVPTAQTLRDSLTTLELLTANQADPAMALVAMAMGEAGVLSRVLGPRAGSLFTFAAATDAEATAPGQLTADVLTQLYRIGSLRAKTRIFAVAGDPIHSSLSPLMHNTAFREASLDAVYVPLRTANAEELFRAARELPLAGFSITMPLKQSVLPLLDHIDPLAASIGAVNTVVRTPAGQLHGFNTDADGIVMPLQQRLPLRKARVLVLGAGGAARAALFGCREQGAEVFLYNRTAAAAEELARQAGATVLAREALSTEQFDVLINSTPAGMRGNACRLPVDEHELRANVVFDLVYNPLTTPLLELARTQGLQTIPGVEMFVHQGARQFELWTGQPAPTAAMQDVVLAALADRG